MLGVGSEYPFCVASCLSVVVSMGVCNNHFIWFSMTLAMRKCQLLLCGVWEPALCGRGAAWMSGSADA